MNKYKNKDLREYFDIGKLPGANDDNLNPFPENDENSLVSQQFCRKKHVISKQMNQEHTGKKLSKITDPEGRQDRFYPKGDQSEFGDYNPIWFILTIMNMLLELILDLFSVFTWMFKLTFTATFKKMTDWDLGDVFGFKPGKKYCFNVLWFRYIILFFCPPAGVFMAYGFSGWLQILICCLASLFYYFPGLVYALIVINRSSVSDYMKKVKSGECLESTDGLGLFVSDKTDLARCTRDVGESCTPEGKQIGGDSKKLDCCMNPALVGGKFELENGKVAKQVSGVDVMVEGQGERYCRADTKKVKTPGICVWRENGKPG